jgi:hypothetical protein
MRFFTLFALFMCVGAQFDIVARYPILESFDQVKCLKVFAPKELKDGIKQITDFLTFVEEQAHFMSPSNDVYLLNTEIGDNPQYDWLKSKQPYVLNSKLSEFPTKCKQLGGSLPSPTTESGVSKLKKWLSVIGVAANIVLPKLGGKL